MSEICAAALWRCCPPILPAGVKTHGRCVTLRSGWGKGTVSALDPVCLHSAYSSTSRWLASLYRHTLLVLPGLGLETLLRTPQLLFIRMCALSNGVEAEKRVTDRLAIGVCWAECAGCSG